MATENVAHLMHGGSARWKQLCTWVDPSETWLADLPASARLTLSRECRVATELTLTTDSSVGGWWRSGGVEEEEVTNCPSGTKWIIQLSSTQTPTAAKRQRSLSDPFCHQQLNEPHHLLEYEWQTTPPHQRLLPPLSVSLTSFCCSLPLASCNPSSRAATPTPQVSLCENIPPLWFNSALLFS